MLWKIKVENWKSKIQFNQFRKFHQYFYQKIRIKKYKTGALSKSREAIIIFIISQIEFNEMTGNRIDSATIMNKN